MKTAVRFGCTALCLVLTACNDTRDLAPESPDSPWRPVSSTGLRMPPGSKGFAAPREAGSVAGVEAARAETTSLDGIGEKPVGLVEMIDVAERHNPQTRIAWEAARQAAIGVGMSRAALLPQLTLSAMGGFQRLAFPLPNYLSSRGYLTSNGAAVFPKLELDYLLFDFGRTRALVQESQQQALAANFGFTATHQALILDVIRAYYAHQAAGAILRASHSAADNAALLLRSARARRNNGEATVVDVALAERNLAQANYDCDKAEDAEHATKHALLATMGLPATTRLTVQTVDDRRLPEMPPQKVNDLIDAALRARPDILADVAKLRAADAALKGARANLAPSISVASNVSAYLGELKTYGTAQSAPASAIAQPQTQAFVQMTWPIFQGGLRANAIHMAESRKAQAEAALAKDQIAVEREVADGQDELETALAQVHSAQILQKTAQTAFDSASQSYAHGVGTFTDASSAISALYGAQAALAVSKAQAFTKAASLAHATGRLVSPGSSFDHMNDEE
ncbi:TolC family protein [Acidomonas methanolica]|uniref:Protein CyaE n=1 Tax=Acidomonas methanolica NBRC 104435 TaxID=1231351 RepID=A0A023D887_ACIMT|nr:TolC family protein [Acidomonas methanolica]MBU2655630.1 TolC family protein [Acidomonas methanolica]TCS21400.1 outer membrane protein TolC [Acidomonas methanolica]GAJ30343.1 hypothetical protein Amme_122_002 [Acidomonas methanolica NBRC 104435]GEL00509.1 protein CyaE [Acidomonas methanolica NBRC 104435]